MLPSLASLILFDRLESVAIDQLNQLGLQQALLSLRWKPMLSRKLLLQHGHRLTLNTAQQRRSLLLIHLVGCRFTSFIYLLALLSTR